MSVEPSSAANWITIFFGSIIILILVSLVWMYLHDRFQTTHAVLRNFPVIGRMRYTMERLGEYFRQYLKSNPSIAPPEPGFIVPPKVWGEWSPLVRPMT